MRLLLLTAPLIACLGASSPVWAEESPNARAAYVERRGLVEADAKCALFDGDVRAALLAGISQTRGALLRSGWSIAQVSALDALVADAARARTCSDARTLASAASARAAFATLVNANRMQFPGWRRDWSASRSPGANGWALSQAIEGPLVAQFGIRTLNGVQQLALVVPQPRGQAPAQTARLSMRDSARAQPEEIGLPQRVAYGLAAGAPSPRARLTFASTRAVERLPRGGQQAAFVFPDAVFGRILALDPRESLEIRIVSGRTEHVLFVEVGDIAAARAFLTMRGS